MKIPFSPEQFMDVMKYYNTTVFPMQVIFYLLGIAAIFLCLKKIRYSDRIIVAILSFLWLWVGIVYQIIFFTDKKLRTYLLIIPLIWSIIGFSATSTLGMKEDVGLLVAGLVGTTMIIIKNIKTRKA